jgi:hypothetical protein
MTYDDPAAATDEPIKFNDLRCGTCAELPDSCECPAATDEDWYGETRREAYDNGVRDGIALCGPAPAATDETALAVIAAALRSSDATYGDVNYDDDAEVVVAALSAAGFVLLPRDLLDELLAVGEAGCGYDDRRHSLTAANGSPHAAAVVEAVGPTP